MAGIIVGYQGYQRSGKTLKAYMDAERYRNQGCKVYSNMTVNLPGWIKISSLSDVPFDYSPKVLLLDEVYSFLDSRNWSNFEDATIFFNTIGKQNIALLFTLVSLDELEKRVRGKMNFFYMVKSDEQVIHYKVIDVVRRKSQEFSLNKSPELFAKLHYDTNQVPDLVDCSLKDFRRKVQDFLNNNNNINNNNDKRRKTL
ncbi:MAG: hypothetical protein HGA22_14155 [Clostridiales bacterium]|nr:hypothetical protein [Clostridiales bacterium]